MKSLTACWIGQVTAVRAIDDTGEQTSLHSPSGIPLGCKLWYDYLEGGIIQEFQRKECYEI